MSLAAKLKFTWIKGFKQNLKNFWKYSLELFLPVLFLFRGKFTIKNSFITTSRLIECWILSHCVKSVRIRSYSGPNFPAFGLNMKRYEVSLRIQSEYRKMWTRTSPNTDTFYAVFLMRYHSWQHFKHVFKLNIIWQGKSRRNLIIFHW